VKDNCARLSPSPSLSRPAGRRMLLAAAAGGLSAALVLIAGCGPVRLVANTNIPPPLVVKIPIGVALFIPSEFSGYVHKEERWSTDWHVDLGKAQTDGITRLFSAMFERVVTVDSVNAGTQVPGGVTAILEPSIEEYAFVTPRDAGSPFYAVSIKYRVNVYLPDGKLADSWGFTGYGTSPSQGLSSQTPLSTATALAMRDAGAKLAVEFREQAVMRGLLPGGESADTSPTAAQPAAPAATTPAATTPPAPGEPPTTEAPKDAAQPGESSSESTGEAPKDPPQNDPAASEPAQDEAASEPVEEEKQPEEKPPADLTAFALSEPFS
jgi:hypothetical protein